MHRSCRRVRRWLPEVAAGGALPPVRWWVRRHIRKCPACARLWQQHERLTAYLHAAAQERPTPPPDLWARIAARLPERATQVQPVVVRRQWRWALAGAFVIVLLAIAHRWRSEKPTEMALSPAPPDPFTVALLHQHLAVTTPTPFNNPTVMAGIVAASERQ